MTKKLIALVVCLAIVAALVPTYVGASGGITGCYDYWWGHWMYLSDQNCDIIEDLMFAGASAVQLGAALAAMYFPPLSPLAELAVALLGVGYALIHSLNQNDAGIKIRLNHTFFHPFPIPEHILTWIGAQPGNCGTVTGYVTHEGGALGYSTITAYQSGQVIVSVGTDENGRYALALSPGTYMIYASHSGYYDLGTAVITSDGSTTTRDFALQHSSGGGGCPFLDVWDGSQWVGEDYLNIHNPDGVDVTYEHVLATVPERVGDAYELRLIEDSRTISDIDQVQLYAVFEDGTIAELRLKSAEHSEYGNVLEQLLESDDLRVQEIGADHNGGTGQSIELEFKTVKPDAEVIRFIFAIEGCNMICKTCV